MDKELLDILRSIYNVLDKLDDRTADMDIENRQRTKKIEEELSNISLFVDSWTQVLK